MSSSISSFDRTTAAAWSGWLARYLLMLAAIAAATYLLVLLVDPFSTGRFALTQRIDVTTTNTRQANAGLVRDARFNGAIIGDSVSAALDPQTVSDDSEWRLLQLSMLGASSAEVIAVASAFERSHHDGRTLEIFVLSNRWCSPDPNVSNGMNAFPGWLYESSDPVYLSRILSHDAVELTLKRLGIWLGLTRPSARADGYTGKVFGRAAGSFQLYQRPNQGPSPTEPFPAIDALAAHIASLPDNRALAIVFAPMYVSTLPVAASVAAARLDACKQRLQASIARRHDTAYLDLMTENPLTELNENYADPLHLYGQGVREFEAILARLIRENALKPE